MVEILLHPENKFKFFAPTLLRVEIDRYEEKLASTSKLSTWALHEASSKVMEKLTFISEDLISQESWIQAFELVNQIDESDTPFVALALDLKCKLWTGDKKLSQGLHGRDNLIVKTSELVY